MAKQELMSRWETLEKELKSLGRIKKLQEKINVVASLKDLSQDSAQKLKITYAYIDFKILMWSPLDLMECDDTESNDNIIDCLMPAKEFEDIIKNVEIMLNVLVIHPEIEFRDDEITLEFVENYKKGPVFQGRKQVIGDLNDLIERISYHFFLGVGHSDPGSEDHKNMVLQEPNLFRLCQGVLGYLIRAGQSNKCAEVAKTMYSLLYYKTSEMYCVFRGQCNAKGVDVVHQIAIVGEEHDALLEELSGYVFSFGDRLMQDTIKLYDIYHLAVTNDYSRSMNSMLRFLEETKHIMFFDQFEFNRALAQLGLCAFRTGHIAEAHTCLSWLYGGGCVDILLGQASTHMPVHEIRRRPLAGYVHTPYHLQIDLRVLEVVYALCTMLLEFPNSEDAQVEQVTSWKLVMDFSRKKSSGTQSLIAGKFSQTVLFDYLTKVEQKQNNFEEISHAIQSLRAGYFRQSIKVVEGLVLWGIIKEGDKLLQFIKTKIQEVAFLNYTQHHLNVDPYHLDDACERFGLSKQCMHQLLSCLLSPEAVHDVTDFLHLTEKLAFFASEHETIFEGSNYKFLNKTPCDSSSASGGLARVASSLVWDETLYIPLHVLHIFLSGPLSSRTNILSLPSLAPL